MTDGMGDGVGCRGSGGALLTGLPLLDEVGELKHLIQHLLGNVLTAAEEGELQLLGTEF